MEQQLMSLPWLSVLCVTWICGICLVLFPGVVLSVYVSVFRRPRFVPSQRTIRIAGIVWTAALGIMILVNVGTAGHLR
jgi:hypothetical protein